MLGFSQKEKDERLSKFLGSSDGRTARALIKHLQSGADAKKYFEDILGKVSYGYIHYLGDDECRQVFEFCFAQGCDPKAKFDNYTPMGAAIRAGSSSTIQLLFKKFCVVSADELISAFARGGALNSVLPEMLESALPSLTSDAALKVLSNAFVSGAAEDLWPKLLSRVWDVNKVFDSYSLLHFAVDNNRCDFIRDHLFKVPEININLNCSRQTPLERRITLETLSLFLPRPDLNWSEVGEDILNHCATQKKWDCINAILDSGKVWWPENKKPPFGRALWAAIDNDDRPLINKILAIGCDMSYRDERGYTCLMYAVRKNMPGAVIQKMIVLGADPDACDSCSGLSVLQHARNAKAEEAIKILEPICKDDDYEDDMVWIKLSSTIVSAATPDKEKTLKVVFNFMTRQVITITEGGACAVNFSDLDNKNGVEYAHKKLAKLGGQPPATGIRKPDLPKSL